MVLIVAKCIVNNNIDDIGKIFHIVLIVAKCIVNSDIGRLYSLLGKY